MFGLVVVFSSLCGVSHHFRQPITSIPLSLLHIRQPLTLIPLPHASACGFLCFSRVFRSFSPYFPYFPAFQPSLFIHLSLPPTLNTNQAPFLFLLFPVFAHTWLCGFSYFFLLSHTALTCGYFYFFLALFGCFGKVSLVFV